jgi:hypothetical protein
LSILLTISAVLLVVLSALDFAGVVPFADTTAEGIRIVLLPVGWLSAALAGWFTALIPAMADAPEGLGLLAANLVLFVTALILAASCFEILWEIRHKKLLRRLVG